jgi:NADH-quinone oxidoreductase subunit A
MFFLQEYLLTFIIFAVSCVFILLGYVVGNVLMSQPEVSYEKVSSYECGFDAFSDAREPFDVKFYLIAILFIIFDVEVIFFFPWVLCIRDLFYYGFYVMFIFIGVLMIGYGYEWKKGCMDWD